MLPFASNSSGIFICHCSFTTLLDDKLFSRQHRLYIIEIGMGHVREPHDVENLKVRLFKPCACGAAEGKPNLLNR